MPLREECQYANAAVTGTGNTSDVAPTFSEQEKSGRARQQEEDGEDAIRRHTKIHILRVLFLLTCVSPSAAEQRTRAQRQK